MSLSHCCSKCSFYILRGFQFAFMVVTLGVNAWLVSGYDSKGLLAPVYILSMFIISLLGVAWILYMAFFRSTPRTMSETWLQLLIVECAFFGFLVWAITRQAFVAGANCSEIQNDNWKQQAAFQQLATVTGSSQQHVCSLLMVSFAFGILEAATFLISGIIVAMHWQKLRPRLRYYTVLPRYQHRRGPRQRREKVCLPPPVYNPRGRRAC